MLICRKDCQKEIRLEQEREKYRTDFFGWSDTASGWEAKRAGSTERVTHFERPLRQSIELMNTKDEVKSNILEKSKSFWPVLAVFAAVAAFASWSGIPTNAEAEADVVVYKSPTCGCCGQWVEHLRDNGLDVKVVRVNSTEPIRLRLGVPRKLASCHTAVTGDYWVEGHVPADLVRQLMTEQPANIRGIAAPGMSIGSPGMEGPNASEYEVMAYDATDNVSVYATRQGNTTAQ